MRVEVVDPGFRTNFRIVGLREVYVIKYKLTNLSLQIFPLFVSHALVLNFMTVGPREKYTQNAANDASAWLDPVNTKY